MHDYKQEIAGQKALITPGDLRLEPSRKHQLRHSDAAKALLDFWHISAHTQVPVKTFGPDQGEVHYTDGSGRIATLDDVVVTLMRLTNPNTGIVSLQMSLEYRATSHGSRTPDGRSLPGATGSFNPGREPYRIGHTVYFRNSAGGLLYLWHAQDFQLDCGWNRSPRIHMNIETNRLDWFDAVERYNWDVSGAFFRC